MISRHFSPRQNAIAAILTAGGFFLLGYGGILISAGADHSVAIVWPATAFGMCVLLRQPRERRTGAILLAAVFAGGLLANGAAGRPLAMNICYSLINVLEVLAGALATRRFAVPRLRAFSAVLRLTVSAGIGPSLLGGILACGVNAAYGSPDWLANGVHWFTANLLGFCMLFPLGLTVSWRQCAKLRLADRIPEALGVYALVTAVSVLAFRFSPYPLQFLVLLGVCFATVRFRVLGGGVALILAGAIAMTAPGEFAGPDGIIRMELLQLFLAVCSVISMRAASVLNERDLHLALIGHRHLRAMRASRFKSLLLSHVGQEVRNPLSAIIGFSAMLESGSLPSASVIAHNGELLQRLHDDLLDLSRAEAGELAISKERVSLADSLKSCIGALRIDMVLGGKPVVLEETEASLAVDADPLRLAQIINNLIASSYKYGDNHSPIQVRARRLDDVYGRIEIINPGPGIPAREQDGMFQPFGQTEQSGRRVPGAGLGLTIAKLLVEKQGGRIDFQSVPGRQTRFWIDLPFAAQTAA